MRARDFGLVCGTLPTGAGNAITDVPGVRVGHQTIRDGEVNTGVTAILPHDGNLFRSKVPAAVHVINGFGKSVGLVQVEELGSLETPILLTNTLSVADCAKTLIRQAIAANPDIGRTTSTVNPVVCECNDGVLNDIQAFAVSEADALAALHAADGGVVAEGAVGAGTGMVCFGFKGGIGTASRRLVIDGEDRHIGVLVLSNFGRSGDLTLPDGTRATPDKRPVLPVEETEKGSIIVIVATDLPADCRQLGRIAKRAGAGIARLGAFWGNGSGDIVLAFGTASRIDHDETRDSVPVAMLNEARIDRAFQAVAEATQEAILNSLCAADTLRGREGTVKQSLAAWLMARRG